MGFRDLDDVDDDGELTPPPPPRGPLAPSARPQSRRIVAASAVALLVLVVIGGVVRYATAGGDDDQAPAEVSASTSSTSPTQPPPSSAGAAPSTEAATPDSVAVAFVTEWANTAREPDEWLQATAAYASPYFAERLRSVDPTTVPATAVDGDATVTREDATGAAVVVPSDAGSIEVALAPSEQGWQVSNITPQRDEFEHDVEEP